MGSDRGVGEQPGGAGPVDLANPERVCLECAALAVLAAGLRDHELAAHVFERDVVLRGRSWLAAADGAVSGAHDQVGDQRGPAGLV